MTQTRPRTRRVPGSSSARRSGWSEAAPRPSTTGSRSARPASRNWSGTRTRCSSPNWRIPKPVLLKPEETVLVPDRRRGSPYPGCSWKPRCAVPRCRSPNAAWRSPDRFLLDPLTYQQRPAELALKGLRPRILLADVVGLGKTLEIGLILAELIRRGRGERILVVTPQQVLEQFQQELWTRFAIPLIRLDSVGIQRIQREIPAGRNPFTFYKRIIISIDTLKGDAYRHHLENMQWDAVVIDESHNLIGDEQLPQQAGQAARPADRRPAAGQRHPAQRERGVLRRADQHARPGRHRRQAPLRAEGHRAPLYPPHQDQSRGDQRDRRQMARTRPVQADPLPGHPGRGAGLRRAHRHLARHHAPGVTSERRLFPYTLLKAFLSSHKALAKTVENRLKNARTSPRDKPLDHAQAARRADHRRRLRQARRAGRQAQGHRRRPRQPDPRGRLLRERPHPQVAARGPAEAARPHQAGPGRHHARRVLRRSSRRRSSSVSRWPMSRCGSSSPATWPPRA